MPRSALASLSSSVTIVNTLVGALIGRHCLFPRKSGDACIKHGLVHHAANTTRHIHQRGGDDGEPANLADLDPNDLCAACAAEWHIKTASALCRRAAEWTAHAEELRLTGQH